MSKALVYSRYLLENLPGYIAKIVPDNKIEADQFCGMAHIQFFLRTLLYNCLSTVW